MSTSSAIAERPARRAYQLKCCSTVVLTQTDGLLARGALSATATFYSDTCIVLYTHRCSRLKYRKTCRHVMAYVWQTDFHDNQRCWYQLGRSSTTTTTVSVVFSKRSRSLYAIAVPSVCRLSVCNVLAPYSAGWNFRQFFSPYDSPGTLVFWCQNSLVGDAPFPLKFAFKVTHPLSNSAISTNIGS